MAECCDHTVDTGAVNRKQRRALWIVLFINAVMFMVLIAAAVYGKTVSLFADSFDNLGDAVTYGISIWAVGRGAKEKARVSLFKGGLIFLGGSLVLVNIIRKLIDPQVPVVEIMSLFSILALIANLTCLTVLWKHRRDDINMESVWHCSRNDIATNVSVFLTGGLVWYFNSWWPDVIVAGGLVILLFHSALKILSKSEASLRSAS